MNPSPWTQRFESKAHHRLLLLLTSAAHEFYLWYALGPPAPYHTPFDDFIISPSYAGVAEHRAEDNPPCDDWCYRQREKEGGCPRFS